MADTSTSWQDVLTIDKTIFDGTIYRRLKIFAVDLESYWLKIVWGIEYMKKIRLKRFLKCANCGGYLRGYKAYKNQKYYYKCNKAGCNCNMRAERLHEAVMATLQKYTVDINDDYRKLIKAQIIAT